MKGLDGIEPEYWKDQLDPRQRSEVEYCRIYAEQFAHGTDGHNMRLLISQLALLLDDAHKQLRDLKKHGR